MTKHKFSLGQTLWLVPSNNRSWAQEREVTVTKIGRIWIEIGHERFNAETMWVDAGNCSSPDRVWLCKADWEAERDRQEAWQVFWKHMRDLYQVPNHLTTAQIKALTETVKGGGVQS